MTYEIKGFHKIIERDNWKDGCQMQGGFNTWIDCPLQAETIDDLKEQILSFVGAGPDAMEVDACDEAGRIDVQKTENDDGYDPSYSEMVAWKAGRIDLWAVTYVCYVERVSRETVPLAA